MTKLEFAVSYIKAAEDQMNQGNILMADLLLMVARQRINEHIGESQRIVTW